MKWNMVLSALVVSVGLCGQSFGFELLERMLGLNDCGCNTCCQKSCQPTCGCEKGCEPACAACPELLCCGCPQLLRGSVVRRSSVGWCGPVVWCGSVVLAWLLLAARLRRAAARSVTVATTVCSVACIRLCLVVAAATLGGGLGDKPPAVRPPAVPLPALYGPRKLRPVRLLLRVLLLLPMWRHGPACSCNAAPSCCQKSCCHKRHCHSLLGHLGCHSCCKKPCGSTCNSCNTCSTCAAEPSCGCGGSRPGWRDVRLRLMTLPPCPPLRLPTRRRRVKSVAWSTPAAK